MPARPLELGQLGEIGALSLYAPAPSNPKFLISQLRLRVVARRTSRDRSAQVWESLTRKGLGKPQQVKGDEPEWQNASGSA